MIGSVDSAKQKMMETTVRRARFERPTTGTVFELIVVEGPDAGVGITLEPGSALVVGISPTCRLRLTDRAASAHQFSLQINGAHLRLRDVSAGKDTRVNGVLVSEASLSGGEVIRTGETLILVQRTERRKSALPAETSFGRAQGQSLAMRALYPAFLAAARSSSHVLLEGERGVGKRLLAEELHQHGRTADDVGPFVVWRRDLQAELVETVFEGGGLFDQARGGTLYIEDVAALEEATQRALAAALGTNERTAVKVRVIAAARRRMTLTDELAHHWDGGAGVRLTLPPLRDRSGDVMFLARLFWVELGGEGSLPDDFAAPFEAHSWPGNIRELRMAVRARVLHGATTAADCPPARVRNGDHLACVIEQDLSFVRARKEVLAEFEHRYVTRALKRADRHVGRAAAASGIAHRYFQVLKSRAL
jgi:two-component system, NtrC family, response regulator HydG